VRGQTLTIEEFLAYSRRFGRLKPHRVKKTRHAEYPELTVMGLAPQGPTGKSTRPSTIAAAAGTPIHLGHRDLQGHPALRHRHSLERGDTLFASMYEAYETLPDGLKKRLEGLKAEHAYGGRGRRGNELLDPEDRNRPPAVHPIVRTHEETGRKSCVCHPTTSSASRASVPPKAKR